MSIVPLGLNSHGTWPILEIYEIGPCDLLQCEVTLIYGGCRIGFYVGGTQNVMANEIAGFDGLNFVLSYLQ